MCIRDRIYVDGEFVRFGRKQHASEMVVVRVELPIEDAVGGHDVQRVAENWGPTVRRGAQLYNLRTDGDRFVAVSYTHLDVYKRQESR